MFLAEIKCDGGGDEEVDDEETDDDEVVNKAGVEKADVDEAGCDGSHFEVGEVRSRTPSDEEDQDENQAGKKRGNGDEIRNKKDKFVVEL